MTTVETLEQSYAATAEQLQLAAMNCLYEEANVWALVLSQIGRQLDRLEQMAERRNDG